MPRSGSTLIEQILSSHSAVEGTTELPEIISMAKDLRGQATSEFKEIAAYGERWRRMSPQAFGTRRTLPGAYAGPPEDRPPALHRQDAEQFPARRNDSTRAAEREIIDARRHPLACCFSNFKQHYARGQRFSYDLTDLGRYYRDYVELMAHFDDVLPGRSTASPTSA